MNDISWLHTVALVCPLVFLAGFVDSIAGGGGVISLPAYLAAGLPAHLAAGTNKCSAMFGTSVAALRYRASGKMRAREAGLAAIAALPGAWLGTKIALSIDSDALRAAMLIVIPFVAAFMVIRGGNKGTKKEKITGTSAGKRETGHDGDGEATRGWPERFRARFPDRVRTARAFELSLPPTIGFAIGMYDGLIGPGTGTFLILAFSTVLGRSLVVSSGNAKLVNLASNVMSGIVFFASGKVWIALAVPAALCTIAGGWLGSHLAVKNGSRIIRPVMLFVLALLFVKIALDVFNR